MKLISEEDREELEVAIRKNLTETEKQVIALRFGLDGENEHSQMQTAQRVNLPVVVVREAEELAILKLRARMVA
jgi:DNA-directed RNA polymerase sigma subunit (sigma70/sigma32)